jgi:hypothetical protein
LKVSYGLHKRMSIKYIARARESLIKDLDLPREWHVTDCYNAYKKIAADPASDSHARIKATDSIVHLLGVAAPARHLIADVSPPKPAPSMLPDKRRALIENSKTRELLCQLCEASNALDLEPEPRQPLLNQGSRLQLPSPYSTISN